MSDFVHLHVHSHYSLLDGLSKIPQIVSRVKLLGQPAVALTDHGNMTGSVEFYKAAKDAGIKPIVGIEAYLVGNREHKQNEYWHITLLAKNNDGYKNLIWLCSDAWINGFRYKPRMTLKTLLDHREGLVVASGCLSGPIAKSLELGAPEKAVQLATMFKNYFGPDFYIEIMNHGLDGQKQMADRLMEFAQKQNIKPVATNDAHYCTREDAESHDALLCIQRDGNLTSPDHPTYGASEFYLKSRDEMAQVFPAEYLDSTEEIASKCNIELKFNTRYFPKFGVPSSPAFVNWRAKRIDKGVVNDESFDYLVYLCSIGFRKFVIDTGLDQSVYQARLKYELSIIKDKGLWDYFLVVSDFLNHSRAKGIRIGFGRGSAAGALISYLIGITGIDPVRWGLLFERFMNPARQDFPDIDIDIQDNRRKEVIDYVVQKYGKDYTCYIGTINKMNCRAVLRDVARVLGYSPEDTNAIMSNIPQNLEQQDHPILGELIGNNDEVKAAADAHPRLFAIAQQLECTARHVGLHAAGLVVSSVPVCEIAPIMTVPGPGEGVRLPATQWEMGIVDKVGLVKIDYLGLKQLRIVDETLNLIEQRHGKKIILPT